MTDRSPRRDSRLGVMTRVDGPASDNPSVPRRVHLARFRGTVHMSTSTARRQGVDSQLASPVVSSLTLRAHHQRLRASASRSVRRAPRWGEGGLPSSTHVPPGWCPPRSRRARNLTRRARHARFSPSPGLRRDRRRLGASTGAPYPDWAGVNEDVLVVMFAFISALPDGRSLVRDGVVVVGEGTSCEGVQPS